jgi:uncharacterized membrane protein YqhA
VSIDLSHGDPDPNGGNDDPRHHRALLSVVVGGGRFGVLFAIFGLGLASALLLIYSTLVVLKSIWDTITSTALDVDHAKHLAVVFIELTDAYLLGTVLYIIAIGLYQLFIDSTLPLPRWLRVDTIDQLKSKLVGVIVVLLGVSFLAAVVEGSADRGLLDLGIATGIVILALGVHGYLAGSSGGHD